MNKLYSAIGALLLTVSLPIQAQHRHHHHHNHSWMVPMIVGGVVTYAITQHLPPAPPPPVYYPHSSGMIVLQPNQRIVCGQTYQVYSSRYGPYEVKQNCWIQQY